MERFGWENVRGGDFLLTESYLLGERIKHIYDLEENKIKYYVTDNRKYLFGSCDDWLIYVLELDNDCFYIGSCKHLGKTLGAHFNGSGIDWTRNNPVIKVLELIIVKQESENYLALKNQLQNRYIERYGWANVMGGQRPGKKLSLS